MHVYWGNGEKADEIAEFAIIRGEKRGAIEFLKNMEWDFYVAIKDAEREEGSESWKHKFWYFINLVFE